MFALYIAALLALGFKWLSPLSAAYERATWFDVLIAAAVAAWAVEWLRGRPRPRLRVFHLALALYLGAGVLSAAFAADSRIAAETVLLMFELGALAILTSEFVTDPKRRRTVVMAICAVSLATGLLAVVGLALFYLGHTTSLIGDYGEQFIPSNAYARVDAGFYSAPLLASYCIFASAVVARDDVQLPRGLRLATQVTLALLVVSTLSRAIIGFAVGLSIRFASRHREQRRVLVAAAAAVVASVALIAALSVGRLHLDPVRPSTITYEVPDPHNRREAFATSLDTLAEHPIVGLGPGSLPGVNDGDAFRAHFTPLNVAATMGLPALAALIFLIWTLWSNRRRPTPVATWSGLAGLAIDALAGDIDHYRSTWLMIGFADADRERR